MDVDSESFLKIDESNRIRLAPFLGINLDSVQLLAFYFIDQFFDFF